MATNPNSAPDRHQAELAAAALLLSRRYDLPNLIRAARVKPRAFRQIVPTNALYGAMAGPYLDLVRLWAAQRPALLAAYAEALRTGDAGLITRRLDEIAAEIAARARPDFQAVVAQLERWHRGQWIRRIESATTLNVSALTMAGDVAPAASAATAWNGQLHGDVHAQIKAGVAAALLAGLAIRAEPAVALGGMAPVLKKARKRGLRIGVDQVDRTVRAFDRERAAAASLTRFRWHHTDQAHPRPEHEVRDGRVYSQSNAPNDRASVLPFCKCWEEPLWD